MGAAEYAGTRRFAAGPTGRICGGEHLHLVVYVLDEPRQLERSRSYGTNRLLVVHAHGAYEADRSERLGPDPIGRSDERDVVMLPSSELRAHVYHRTARLERLADELEHGGTTLEQLEEPERGFELFSPRFLEEPGRPAHEDFRALLGADFEEGGPDQREERTFPGRQLRCFQATPHGARTEANADDAIGQVLGSPRHEAGIDGLVQPKDSLGHASGGGDDDDHHARGLERQNLDMPDRRRLEGGRRHDGEKPRRA